MLDITSKSNAPLSELTLKPGGKVELRVHARPISDVIPSHFLAQRAPSRRTSRVGSADALSSKDVNPELEVRLENVSDISIFERLNHNDLGEMVSDLKVEEASQNPQQLSGLSKTVCLEPSYRVHHLTFLLIIFIYRSVFKSFGSYKVWSNGVVLTIKRVMTLSLLGCDAPRLLNSKQLALTFVT
jgi:hypothetical protein